MEFGKVSCSHVSVIAKISMDVVAKRLFTSVILDGQLLVLTVPIRTVFLYFPGIVLDGRDEEDGTVPGPASKG